MSNPLEEADRLKNQVDRYVLDGKIKQMQIKTAKKDLEAHAQAAYKKIDDAKAAKKKVNAALDKFNSRKQVNIGERLKSAFGAVSKNFSDSLKKSGFAGKSGISDAGVYLSDSTFEELTLTRTITKSSSARPGILWNIDHEMAFGTMVSGKDVFAPPPMISFSKSKNLVITEIDGTDGEIVERYGDKSWEIKMQGILIDMKNHRYPQAGVVKLREFFNTSEALTVTSHLFADLDIKSIYFTSVDISGVSGFADTIQYTLSAKSIKPLEFFFTQKNNIYEQDPIPEYGSPSADRGSLA